MGLFDSKWIVEFEYSDGIFSSYKRATMVVEASSEFSAKDKAKSVLKNSYKFVKVISAHKSGGRDEERKANFTPTITRVDKSREEQMSSYQSSSCETPKKELTQEEREALRERRKFLEEERIKKEKEREQQQKIAQKEKELKAAKQLPKRTGIIGGALALVTFLLGWSVFFVYKIQAIVAKTQLQQWIELGHSETDATGQEFAASIVENTNKANSFIWLPFVVLAIHVLIVIVVVLIAKKKQPGRIEKITRELNENKAAVIH